MLQIAVFACYWNEIEWVEASLEQIDRIDPVEIIISDGCFDPARHPHSTDGTLGILQDYVSGRANARLVPAVRISKIKHLRRWLSPLPFEQTGWLTIPKLRIARRFSQWNIYRLNQMATFNEMLRISEHTKPGRWFMTLDCDQFYSNSMLEQFKIINEPTDFSLMVGLEYTFFGGFNLYTDKHEKRDYNNMPHKMSDDTRFIPTRHPARVHNHRYRIYSEITNKHIAGTYFHYHHKSQNRLEAGYMLGDRKAPDMAKISLKEFGGQHPSIIEKYFLGQ